MTLKLIVTEKNKKEPIYLGPHFQVPFMSCFSPALNNPFLNSIYKSSIPYTERWYLEARRLVLEEEWSNPILELLMEDEDLKRRLVQSTVIDGAYMRDILAKPELTGYHVSAGVNLNRLRRWSGFFVSL